MDETQYRRPVKVIAYLYRRTPQNQIEYLLLKRTHDTAAGSIWQTVVGSARWGEGLAEAVRREVFEETSLTRLHGFTAIGYAFSFKFKLDPKFTSYYAPKVDEITNMVFAAEVQDEQEICISTEHVGYRWFTFEGALQKIYWVEDREAINRLHPMIKGEWPL